MLPPDSTKLCHECGVEKIREGNFSKIKDGDKFRWSVYCTPCRNIRGKRIREADPEKHRAYVRKYRSKDPDKVKLQGRASDAKPERKAKKKLLDQSPKVMERKRLYMKSEAGIAAYEKYRASPDAKATKFKYYTSIKDTLAYKIKRFYVGNSHKWGFVLSEDLNIQLQAFAWKAICEVHDHKCVFCGKEDTARSLNIEHMTSRHNGGVDEIYNFAPSCKSCNSRKNTKNIEEFHSWCIAQGLNFNFNPTQIRALSQAVHDLLF